MHKLSDSTIVLKVGSMAYSVIKILSDTTVESEDDGFSKLPYTVTYTKMKHYFAVE